MNFEVSKRTRVFARIGAITSLVAAPLSSLGGMGSDTLSWALTAIGTVLGIVGYLSTKAVGTQSQLISAEIQTNELVLTYMSTISNTIRTISIADIRDIQLRDDIRKDSLYEPDLSLSTVGPCIVIRYRDRKRKVLFASVPIPTSSPLVADIMIHLMEQHQIKFYRRKSLYSDDDVRTWIGNHCRTENSTDYGLEFRQRSLNSFHV